MSQDRYDMREWEWEKYHGITHQMTLHPWEWHSQYRYGSMRRSRYTVQDDNSHTSGSRDIWEYTHVQCDLRNRCITRTYCRCSATCTVWLCSQSTPELTRDQYQRKMSQSLLRRETTPRSRTRTIHGTRTRYHHHGWANEQCWSSEWKSNL